MHSLVQLHCQVLSTAVYFQYLVDYLPQISFFLTSDAQRIILMLSASGGVSGFNNIALLRAWAWGSISCSKNVQSTWYVQCGQLGVPCVDWGQLGCTRHSSLLLNNGATAELP